VTKPRPHSQAHARAVASSAVAPRARRPGTTTATAGWRGTRRPHSRAPRRDGDAGHLGARAGQHVASATGRTPAARRSRGSKPAACARRPRSPRRVRAGEQDLEQEPVELGLGKRVGALVLDRVLVAMTRTGRAGSEAGRRRSPGALPSPRAARPGSSGRAVDLVREQQVREDRPLRNENSAVRASYTSEPVTSPGMRSGVNCTRLVSRSSAADRVRTSSVLATPGTPSSSTWPRHSRAMTRPVTAASWPTTALATSARTAPRVARSSAAVGALVGSGWLRGLPRSRSVNLTV